jgi:hypothetical protein
VVRRTLVMAMLQAVQTKGRRARPGADLGDVRIKRS